MAIKKYYDSDCNLGVLDGKTVAVIGGVWKDTVGVITALDIPKQTATINVELFGRETPVEISFAEIKQM